MPNCTVSNLSQGCLQAVFDELNKLFNLIKTPYCAHYPFERGYFFSDRFAEYYIYHYIHMLM